MSKEKPVALGHILDLEIEGISHQGWGIGRYEGFTVFVPGSLLGETVKVKIYQVKKTYAVAELVKVINDSSHRTEPSCSAYAYCGGCSIQHAQYEHQLQMKDKILLDALTKIGKLKNVQVHPILGMPNPWKYRNRIQLHVKVDGDQVEIGFFKPGTHELVSFEECGLVPDVFNHMRNFLVGELNKYLKTGDISPLKHIVLKISAYTQEVTVVFVTSKRDFSPIHDWAGSLVKNFTTVVSVVQNIQEKNFGTLFGPKWQLILGKKRLEDKIGDVIFSVSPGSFVQVNPEQTRVLYDQILKYADLAGQETVLDLYCGIGTISLLLAQKAGKVIGIEEFKEAVDDGESNARINNFTNVEFMVGKAEVIIPEMGVSGINPDIIVLDPPRKGCDPVVLEAIVRMKPQKMIYVSCDPATLARDLKILGEKGYKTKEVQPVDMFPQTEGIECVAKLTPICRIRPMQAAELKEYYHYIKRDFKKGEYPPFDILSQQLDQGIQEGIVFTEEGQDLAYAIVYAENTNGYVLVSLFAVLPEKRGEGIGSKFLEILKERYDGKQGIIVEVECLDSSLSKKEYDLQRRRIEFYEKAGFYLITGINYSIWDIPMHLMALPILASQDTINGEIDRIMTDIYEKLLSLRFSHKMVISRTS